MNQLPELQMDEEIIVLMDKYATEVLRMCYVYTKDEFASQDIVQETFIKVYLKYSNFRHDSSEKTWIMRIAINLCKDYLKKAAKENKNRVELTEEIKDCTYEESQSEKEILDAVNKLSDKYKEVILLFYYSNLPVKEIAKLQRSSETAVNVRLHRAREILKQELRRSEENV